MKPLQLGRMKELNQRKRSMHKSSGNELSEVTVGVIDTGADYTHPLIADRIEHKTINFSSSGNENDCMDDRGHGTMVASVIAQNTYSY